MAHVDSWLIVGHRRWAREMAYELSVLTRPQVCIRLVADPEDQELQNWLSSKNLARRVQIVKTLPTLGEDQTGVALIVNSAHQHVSEASAALQAGYHVVSEKPVALSIQELQYLINCGQEHKRNLYCTNTYQFASYLSVLRDRWLKARNITHLSVEWEDPSSEVRRGESKSYDSGVPIIFDVLPHVANIIVTTVGPLNLTGASLEVARGGSNVSIRYKAHKMTLNVHLKRDSKRRLRKINCRGADTLFALDFTEEPGMLRVGVSEPALADAEWNARQRPIAAMLASVIESIESNNHDERLCVSAAVFGQDLIDKVASRYADIQIDFLRKSTEQNFSSEDKALRYALREALAIADRVAPGHPLQSPLRRIASTATSLPAHIRAKLYLC